MILFQFYRISYYFITDFAHMRFSDITSTFISSPCLLLLFHFPHFTSSMSVCNSDLCVCQTLTAPTVVLSSNWKFKTSLHCLNSVTLPLTKHHSNEVLCKAKCKVREPFKCVALVSLPQHT
jgi:hypothetical protein